MAYPRVYKEYEPSSHLRQFVRCYWRYEKDFALGEFEHVFPDSSYELVYEQGSLYQVNEVDVPRFFFVGQLAKPVDFYTIGMAKSWAIRFYPWGLRPFGDVSALAGHQWLPAADALDSRDYEALSRIMQNENEQQVILELDTFLTKKLLLWEFSDAVLEKAISKLRQQKTDVSIQDIADACFVSRRQLTRKFTAATGKAPQEVAMRLRFEMARDMIMHNPDISFTYLAQHCGYTDQSHLTKEFRRFADMTPSAYANIFQQARPNMQNQDNVLFLQVDSDSMS